MSIPAYNFLWELARIYQLGIHVQMYPESFVIYEWNKDAWVENLDLTSYQVDTETDVSSLGQNCSGQGFPLRSLLSVKIE